MWKQWNTGPFLHELSRTYLRHVLTAACTTEFKSHDNVKVRNKSAKSSESETTQELTKRPECFFTHKSRVDCKGCFSKCTRLLLQLLLLLFNITKNNIEVNFMAAPTAAAAAPTDAATAAAVCGVRGICFFWAGSINGDAMGGGGDGGGSQRSLRWQR